MMAGNANSQLIRDCDGFAAAKCTPDPDSELGTHPLTTEDDCQAGCLLDAACMDYTWNPNVDGADKCKWYVDNYRQNCAVYAGSRDTKLDVCIKEAFPFNNDCDRYMLIDCEYNFRDDQLIEEANRGSIVDAYHCQEYCEVFAAAGCDYWVFESSETAPLKMSTCKLYSYNFDASVCSVHHGPSDAPPFSISCPPETVTIQFQSKNYPDYRVGINREESLSELYIVNDTKNFISFTEVRPGLTGDPETVSFQSKEDGKYMANENSLLNLQDFEDGPGFANSATFRIYPDKFFDGFVSIEPVNQPGSFIRHYSYRLNANVEADDELYKNDASWLIMGDVPGI